MARLISKILKKYNELIAEEYSKIRIIKDDDKKIQMNLDDIYIPLILKGTGFQEKHNIEKYEAKDLLSINMKRIIVLGDPGMGKSTMLRYIAGNTCRSEEKSPVYIKLSEFSEHLKLTKDANKDDELEEFVIEKVKKIEKSMVKENVDGIEEAFKNGNMLILLDGMDEVTDENYKLVEEKIIDFSRRNNQCKIIMTSRKNNFKADQFSENVFEIDKLSLDKICKYIDVFYSKIFNDDVLHKVKAVKALENQIEMNPEIHRMAKNPFLLSILCLIGKNADIKLPKYRLDLYDRCCELLLEYRDLNKLKNKNCDIRMKKIVLKEVAYNTFIEGKEVVEKEFILNIIKDQIKSGEYKKCENCTEDECLDSLCNVNEILRKFGVGKYEFVHRTVCEYYASKKLSEKKNVFELINNNMWEEPIKLYVAQIKSPDEADSFLMKIIEKDKGLALRSCLEMSKEILKNNTIGKIFNKINLSQRVELIEGLIYSTEDNGKKVLDTLKVLLENETDLDIMGHAILKLEDIKKLNKKNDDLINSEIDRLIESVIGSKEVQKQRYIDYIEEIMVPIKGKEFVMGSPEDEPERCLYWSNKENKLVTIESEIQHNVVLSDFYISKFPITIEIL